ncbi:MAG: hypothetical protein EBS19_09035, partial [Spirochaetia bacterium]|nr:hypothetical protein [Spirochaetia bacterium]
SFTNIGGQSRNYMAGVGTGGNTMAWNASASTGDAYAMFVYNSNLYVGGNFKTDNVNQSLFGGQLAAMQALPYIDAKLNASTAGGSIKGKIQRTPPLKKALIEAFRSGQQVISLPYGVIKSKGQSKPIAFSQEDLASSGFIPNFSALREAISREVSAGVPASSIRVGSSSSLMSNKNPLGLGVYNTKDEPLGLNQGINRFSSKREAKMAGAASGYIPNFAYSDRNQYGTPYSQTMPKGGASLNIDQKLGQIISQTAKTLTSLNEGALNAGAKLKTLSTSVSKVKVYFDDNQLPASIQKYKGNLIQASIGLSLASGLLQEAFKESPKVSEAIESFSSTLSLAGTAAQIIPGKAGVFGAALVATTGAFGIVANLLKDKSTKLADKAEQAGQSLTDFSNSSQRYADVLQKLEEARKDPKASAATIEKLNQDLVDSASQIPEAYRRQLASITNYTDLLDKMSQIQGELANEEAYYKGAAQFEDILNKRTGNEFARFAEALSFKPLFNPRESMGFGFTGSEFERTTKNILEKGFENKERRDILKEKLASGQLDIFKTSRNFDAKDLEKLGLRKSAIENLERLRTGDRGEGRMNAETIVQGILTGLLKEVIAEDETKKANEERQKQTDLIAKENAEKQRTLDLEKSRQDALDNFYQRLIEIGDIQAEFRDKLAFNQKDVQLQRASGLLQYSRGSMGAQAAREYEFNLENSKRQLEFS